jgi:hypothetical protein
MSIPTEQKEHERRVGENQALFRDVNERINAVNEARSVWVKISEWVCECADEACTERIEMTPEEYEGLLKSSTSARRPPRHQAADLFWPPRRCRRKVARFAVLHPAIQ